jgi:mRNA-degrading endonuclease RelE of RelBE toxin-antitoxin system
MAKQAGFRLSFTSEAIEHLDSIEAKHHGLIRKTIAEQLTHSPLGKTRNRKPLVPPAPFQAAWELRCGPGNRFRVFYNVDSESRTVRILAVGVKDRSRVLFGEREEEE